MKKFSWRRISIYGVFLLLLSLLSAFQVDVSGETLDAIVTVTVAALGAFGLEDVARAVGEAWTNTKKGKDNEINPA